MATEQAQANSTGVYYVRSERGQMSWLVGDVELMVEELKASRGGLEIILATAVRG